jgi:tRNA threonylcarbamoyladenosine biosynthesis protein TsaB
LTKTDFTSAEALILALDTSSKVTSLAVARGAALLRSIRELPDQKRSETLWSAVKAVLAELGMTISEVDILSVCTGPGGFTGLRVGMAAVMGFAAATNKPLVGVTSLEATAFAPRLASPVLALVNAYKGEVYSQLFSFDSGGVPVPRNDPMVSTPKKAIERVADEDDLIIAGNGVEAVAGDIERILASGGKKSTLRLSDGGLAEAIAQLGLIRYERGEIQTPASLKAIYVRPSEAEIKLSLGLLGSKIKRSMKPERL